MKSLIKLLSDARPSKFSAACAYAFCSIQNLIKSVSDATPSKFSAACGSLNTLICFHTFPPAKSIFL